MQNLSNLVREFKFAKLDLILKTKLDSVFICKYGKLNLSQSCETDLTVHDKNHEFDFSDRVPNKKH